MVSPIPKSVKKVWDEWNIRGVILFSLTLQTFLILFAPLRKRTAKKLVILLIWSAYLLADWAANFAVGLISNSQGTTPGPSEPAENSDLLAFWAPFLLLHLGGPDTITAFALEDNELWLRHFLGLIFQAVASLYAFVQSLPDNKLLIPTLLLFFAGIIKYAERTRALYLASLDRFRDSMLKDPDPGPNYAKLMEEYASKREAKLPTQIIMIREPDKEFKDTGISVKMGKLSDLEVVQYAYHYFKIFKGLIVDLIFSFRERNESREFFNNRTPEDALRVIEAELNFIYEALYTKVVVVHKLFGYIFRFISFSSVVAALAIFHFKTERHGFKHFDVGITYTLLLGAIGLELIALLMLVFSDWTFVSIMKLDKKPESILPLQHNFLSTCIDFICFSKREKEPRSHKKSTVASILCCLLSLKRPWWIVCETESFKQEVLATPILLRRWSGSISGHNFVRYCLKGRPKKIHKVNGLFRIVFGKVIHYLGIDKVFDQVIQCMALISSKIIHKLGINRVIHSIAFTASTVFHYLGINKLIQYLGIVVDKIIDCLGLMDFVDEIRYVSREPLTKELWKFIFEELKNKSQFADDPETAKRISSARGDWVLQDSDWKINDRSNIMSYVVDVTYDESLLLWHIATELCYNTDEPDTENYNDRQNSKLLSDYMLYLLVMQPTMMSAVAGIGKIRFRDTWAEAERFFSRKGIGPKDEKAACKRILDVNTDVKPEAVKGDRSKSVLFDASIMAKELKKLDGEKWKIMSRVWVELLSYAASQCRANTLAQQVSKGGELVTFVWLLMAHFGLGDQFQINEGHARAKLIVGK